MSEAQAVRVCGVRGCTTPMGCVVRGRAHEIDCCGFHSRWPDLALREARADALRPAPPIGDVPERKP